MTDQNHPPRGLNAILKTASANPDELERGFNELLSERQKPGAYAPSGEAAETIEPLSTEAEAIISKGIILPAEKIQKEANEAVGRIRDEAQDFADEVAKWGDALVKNARETAARIAEEHAVLRRTREHFQRGYMESVWRGKEDATLTQHESTSDDA